MKVLILALLLVSLIGAQALRRRTSVRQAHSDPAHKIAEAVAVLDALEELSTSESANQAFWENFFDEYDTDENGLDKDEFHHGIDVWTQANGFGHQSKPGTDAIWDQLNADGDETLTLEEAIQGSQSIFQWYKLISQNVLRVNSFQLINDLQASRCRDTEASVAGFQYYPEVSGNIGASWDTDGDGQLSFDEVQENNGVLMDMLFLEHIPSNLEEEIFNGLDQDGDEYLTTDQAGAYIEEYLKAVLSIACGSEDYSNDQPSLGGQDYPSDQQDDVVY